MRKSEENLEDILAVRQQSQEIAYLKVELLRKDGKIKALEENLRIKSEVKMSLNQSL